MSIKETVRKLAQEAGTSLPKLELELGFGAGTISKWDKSAPSVDKLNAIADYFNVTVDYLLSRDKPEQKSSKPKDLKKILAEEEITLNGRMVSPEDKEKMLRIIEALYYDAKEENKRKS